MMHCKTTDRLTSLDSFRRLRLFLVALAGVSPATSVSQETATESLQVCEIAGDHDYLSIGDIIELRESAEGTVTLLHRPADSGTPALSGPGGGDILVEASMLNFAELLGVDPPVVPAATFRVIVGNRTVPLTFNLIRRARQAPNPACGTEAGEDEVLIVREGETSQITYLAPQTP